MDYDLTQRFYNVELQSMQQSMFAMLRHAKSGNLKPDQMRVIRTLAQAMEKAQPGWVHEMSSLKKEYRDFVDGLYDLDEDE